MSTVKTNNVQIGQSVTATNNFTWYQPATPDGTVRLGNGNSGSVTDLVTLTSAGNLGIGTSSPGAKLDVAGNANIKQFISAGNGTTNGYLGYSWNRNLATGALFDNAKYAYDLIMQPGTNTLSLEIYAPGGSTVTGSALVVDTSGNLGIGTSSPAAKLDVKSQINVTNSGGSSMVLAKATYFGYSSTYGATQIGGTSGTYSTVAIGYDPIVNLSGNFSGNGSEVIFRNGVKFITPNATDTDWYSTLTLKDGNLGLGVTPSAWLSTAKAMQISGGLIASIWTTASGAVQLGNNVYTNTSGNDAYTTSGYASKYYQLSGQHIWNTAPSGTAGNAISFTQAMTLDASGRLGVGGSPDTGSTITAVATASRTGVFGAANTAGFSGVTGSSSSNSATGYAAYFSNTGSGTGLYISNTAAWQSTSDARLKEDIKDISTTERLLKIRPVDYLWKSQAESDDPSRRNFGFIAQEMQDVFPELVGETPDGMLSVEYTGLIAPLVKAIQELSAELNELKKRIN